MPAFVQVRVVSTYWGASDWMTSISPVTQSGLGSNFLSSDNFISGPRSPDWFGIAGPNDGPVNESFVFSTPPGFEDAIAVAVGFVFGYEPYEIHVSTSDDGVTFGPENSAVVEFDSEYSAWRAIVPLAPPSNEITPFWTDYNRTLERQ